MMTIKDWIMIKVGFMHPDGKYNIYEHEYRQSATPSQRKSYLPWLVGAGVAAGSYGLRKHLQKRKQKKVLEKAAETDERMPLGLAMGIGAVAGGGAAKGGNKLIKHLESGMNASNRTAGHSEVRIKRINPWLLAALGAAGAAALHRYNKKWSFLKKKAS